MAAGGWRAWRRRRIRRRPFPVEWARVLRRSFPRYARFAAEDRAKLEALIQVFLAEKRFEGAGGLTVTDEIRLTIAAQAVWLILDRDEDVYPRLLSVIVYPGEYLAPKRGRDEIGLAVEGLEPRLGETAARGAVVVSWEAARQGASDEHGGRSVVLHEFAHLLDAEWGGFDGAPRLPQRSMVDEWARVMGAEYASLRGQIERGEPTDLDPYAATSPAEFFAVSTERFFLEPESLARARPALFDALSRYYGRAP